MATCPLSDDEPPNWDRKNIRDADSTKSRGIRALDDEWPRVKPETQGPTSREGSIKIRHFSTANGDVGASKKRRQGEGGLLNALPGRPLDVACPSCRKERMVDAFGEKARIEKYGGVLHSTGENAREKSAQT